MDGGCKAAEGLNSGLLSRAVSTRCSRDHTTDPVHSPENEGTLPSIVFLKCPSLRKLYIMLTLNDKSLKRFHCLCYSLYWWELLKMRGNKLIIGKVYPFDDSASIHTLLHTFEILYHRKGSKLNYHKGYVLYFLKGKKFSLSPKWDAKLQQLVIISTMSCIDYSSNSVIVSLNILLPKN